jgi:hypothetical protein
MIGFHKCQPVFWKKAKKERAKINPARAHTRQVKELTKVDN